MPRARLRSETNLRESHFGKFTPSTRWTCAPTRIRTTVTLRTMPCGWRTTSGWQCREVRRRQAGSGFASSAKTYTASRLPLLDQRYQLNVTLQAPRTGTSLQRVGADTNTPLRLRRATKQHTTM